MAFRENLKIKRQTEVQDEILRVASKLIAQHGYRAVTIDMISLEMGFSKSSIYYYFKTKEEILWRVIETIYEAYSSRAKDIRAENKLPAETLNQLIRQHILTAIEHKDWTTIFFRDESELSRERQRLIRSRKRSYDAILEDVYEEGVKAKMFRAIPPHIAINGILGMCNSIFNWYDADRSAKPKEIADYFVSILAHGFEIAHTG